jgi:hypothetical protein
MATTANKGVIDITLAPSVTTAEKHTALTGILKLLLPTIAASLPGIVQSLLGDKHGNYRRALIEVRDDLIAANLGDK